MKVIHGASQMSLIRDTEEVVKFLEFAGRKNILNEQQVNTRLTACHNLFAVVNEEEDNIEYMLKNLDVLINRFRNKNTSVQASTLKVYKSRAKSSLEDYQAWSTDPFQWERTVSDRAKSQVADGRKKKKKSVSQGRKAIVKTEATPVVQEDGRTEIEAYSLSAPKGFRRVSFPIRAGFNVEVSFPEDGLTTKELNRLGMFLYPYCQDLEPEATRWPLQ